MVALAAEPGDGPIVIGNAFVDVVVRKVRTRNRMRLDIRSPRRDSWQLDAAAFGCLSFPAPELISALLERRSAP
ncbi:hypothetical protein AB0F91_06575 [Amycolatopsis sp. NPDC023774]|uniref:hypothetical protein n=1 Tax=Amycolatopsis sp. NPDC023774 TaxID=3155015 RepID=UPI0033EC9D10